MPTPAPSPTPIEAMNAAARLGDEVFLYAFMIIVGAVIA